MIITDISDRLFKMDRRKSLHKKTESYFATISKELLTHILQTFTHVGCSITLVCQINLSTCL